MRSLVLLLIFSGLLLGKELTLQEAIELATKNNHLIKAAKRDVKAQELELRAIKGAIYPRIKIEENYTRTDIPAYAFMSKLNQERISIQDFDPSRLNNPKGINNFETKATIEIPIWLGGKLQSARRIGEYEYKAVSLDANRKEEEVIRDIYKAYVDASFAKEAIKVSEQVLKDAKEKLKLAEQMHKVGTALLADVLRGQVYVSKAQENLEKSIRGYEVAKKALEVLIGTPLGTFEVQPLEVCPSINIDYVKEKAYQRSDIKALEERIKALREAYRLALSDNLPQVYAFGQYVLNSKDAPLGSDGKGYMVGLSVSWTFDTGLSTLRKAEANLERKAGLEERLKLLKNLALLEVERAYAEYKNSLEMLKSAEDRIRASQEALRIMELRYKNGLARMVDVLDVQTELDKARLEKIEALRLCKKAYIDVLFSAGLTQEVIK